MKRVQFKCTVCNEKMEADDAYHNALGSTGHKRCLIQEQLNEENETYNFMDKLRILARRFRKKLERFSRKK